MFTSVESWGTKLESSTAFLAEIAGTGGSALITLQLSGTLNIGRVINWEYLGRIAVLKIRLGIGVFPDYQ